MQFYTHLNKKVVILGSSSPRRKELLEQIGIYPIIKSPSIPETSKFVENPSSYVLDIANQKLDAIIAQNYTADLIICADTMLYFEGKMIGKPSSLEDAESTLLELNNKTHEVYTGVSVAFLKENKVIRRESFFESTRVTFAKNDPDIIKEYVATKEPLGKAGSYAIQGFGSVLVQSISGDYSNVVGLPLCKLFQCLTCKE